MKRLFLIFGLGVLAIAWLGPLPHLAEQAFFAHMTMHMAVVAIAAPLLAIGIAGRTWDPVRKLPSVFSPIPASIVELIVVWAWHAPTLHHIARHTSGGLLLEQATFLATGLMVWLSAFGGDPRQLALGSMRRTETGSSTRTRDEDEHESMRQAANRRGSGILALLLTSMHMTLLGALLALTPRPLYQHHLGFAGLSPEEDQHLGGAIMLLVGGISYLVGGVVLTAGLLRHKRRFDDLTIQPFNDLPIPPR